MKVCVICGKEKIVGKKSFEGCGEKEGSKITYYFCSEHIDKSPLKSDILMEKLKKASK